MKTIARILLSGGIMAGITGIVGAAQAADHNDAPLLYFEAHLGAPVFRDYDFTFDLGGPPGTYDPKEKFFINGAFGGYFRNNMRADVSVTYAYGNNGLVTFPGFTVPHMGSISATTILGNVYYEFPAMAANIYPFVGAGAGATIFNYNNLGGPGFQYNDSDAAVTLAAHLGADIPLTEHIDLTGRYSLTWTGEHSVSATTVGPVPITIDGHVNNIFMLGFRVKFGEGLFGN